MDGSNILDIEICQISGSLLSAQAIEKLVFEEISNGNILCNTVIYEKDFTNQKLKQHVISILCCSSDEEVSYIKVEGTTIKMHVYKLYTCEATSETLENDDELVVILNNWRLPSNDFHHLWENLHFESNVKNDLLSFIEGAVVFSDHKVDPHVITWNKIILLYGPPGTGKTSLCKALAQKYAIRANKKYHHGALIEVNSHSLFSKWFSESGKLVTKLFHEVKYLLEDPKTFVCILIDEVESLAHSRKSCNSAVEPADSMRVVNALLTQLDQLKRYSNVLILATSNLSETIDSAFIDRADIKQYIDLPNLQAIYNIYKSCLKELMRVNLMDHEKIYDYSHLKNTNFENSPETKNSLELMDLSQESIGFSGRTLRKLPFLTYALYIKNTRFTLSQFLKVMHLAISNQKAKDIEETVK